MRDVLVGLGCGLIFGAGLLVSGMMQPSKVLAFLDLFGAWDPSLAVVMAAALAVAWPGFAYARRRGQPVFAAKSWWPTASTIDHPLVIGSVLFGIGWGLVVSGSRDRELGHGLRLGIRVRAGNDRGNAASARVAPAQQSKTISTRHSRGRIITDELLQSSTTLALIVAIKSHIVAWARRGPPPHPIPLRAPLKPRRGPPPGGV
jgi:hypothetical protein